MKRIIYHFLATLLIGMTCSCTGPVSEPATSTVLEVEPDIFPDYTDVTVPSHIAPLCFMLSNEAEEAIASFSFGEHKLVCKQTSKGFLPEEKEWNELLQAAFGQKLEIKVYEKRESEWVMYQPFHIEVSKDSIDPYLVYRLIEPGYELWNQMGIFQRNLDNFEQTPIIQNKQTGYNCINCHSFANYNPDKMLLHMRGASGGTYLTNGEQICKLDGKVNEQIQSLVYPSWHPSGNFVAFSTNKTRQGFHMNDRNRIEVFDYTSDILVYDVIRNEVITVPSLFAPNAFETFPSFSPDGKTLYFCSAESRKMPEDYRKVKYSLCSIAFDHATRTFGEKVDTLYNAKETDKSVSFPRVSPEGTFLAFTLSDYGNFSIWHQEADLYLIRLKDHHLFPLEAANSEQVESYHSWSSNGRWLVFSSRRNDGLYTHPHFIHIDGNGAASKPFVLPQKDAAFYRTFMYSYNIPEFTKARVDISSHRIAKEAKEGNYLKIGNKTEEKGK